MKETTYNGWTNFTTWRVRLELFDDYRVSDSELMLDAYALSDHLKDMAEVYIEDTSTEGLARDYALAFLADVNWHEIAKHMIGEYSEVQA